MLGLAEQQVEQCCFAGALEIKLGDTVTVTVIATGVADRSNLSPIFGKKAQTTAKPSYTAPTQTPSAEAAPTVAPKVALKDAPERFTPSKDEGNIIIPTFLKRK